MPMRLSRILAMLIGVLAPLLDTVRRWHTWMEWPPALLDDYLLGAILLYGVWRTGKDPVEGQRFLSAGWGVALGMVVLSFFGQIEGLMQGRSDPAPVSSEVVAVVKGFGLVIVIIGLGTSLKKDSVAE
jgi:hypothetical protein